MEWKQINTFRNYSVSNAGFIRNNKTGKILKNSKDANGYAVVNLFLKGKAKKEYVHRIVGLHFLSNKENKPQVAHIDGNGMNPDVTNLRWSTQLENEQDKKAHGRDNKNCCGGRKFNYEDLIKIHDMNKKGFSFRKISRLMDVSHHSISGIVNKVTYKNYDIQV